MQLAKTGHARIGTMQIIPVLALKGDRPSGFTFLTTRRCNLSCRHCATDSGPEKTEAMDIKTAKKVIINIMPLVEKDMMRFISISGGEPLLYENIKRTIAIVESIHSKIQDKSLRSKHKPRLFIITSGVVGIENVKMLKQLTDKAVILTSSDRYHPKEPSEVESLRQLGFSVYLMDSEGTVAIGRAYDLDDEKETFDVNSPCIATGIRYAYIAKEDTILIEHVPVSENRFIVFEDGTLNFCGNGMFAIGNLAEEDPARIARAIESDERLSLLQEEGPLGLAQVYGKLDQAVAVYLKKGICGICEAFRRGIL